jgi:hypothetical protein
MIRGIPRRDFRDIPIPDFVAVAAGARVQQMHTHIPTVLGQRMIRLANSLLWAEYELHALATPESTWVACVLVHALSTC